MQGRAFLQFARSLDQDASEACRRTQISRAYYAAFLEARHAFQHLGFHVPSRRPREHADVANVLGESDRQLRFDLSSLRALRNGADYDLHISRTTIVLQAEEAIRLAASIIDRLDILASDGEEAGNESVQLEPEGL